MSLPEDQQGEIIDDYLERILRSNFFNEDQSRQKLAIYRKLHEASYGQKIINRPLQIFGTDQTIDIEVMVKLSQIPMIQQFIMYRKFDPENQVHSTIMYRFAHIVYNALIKIISDMPNIEIFCQIFYQKIIKERCTVTYDEMHKRIKDFMDKQGQRYVQELHTVDELLTQEKIQETRLKSNLHEIIADGHFKSNAYTEYVQTDVLYELINCGVDEFVAKLEQKTINQLQQSMLITQLMIDEQQRHKVLYIARNDGSCLKMFTNFKNQIAALCLYLLDKKYEHYCMQILTYIMVDQDNKELQHYFAEKIMFGTGQLCQYLVHMDLQDKTYLRMFFQLLGELVLGSGREFSPQFYTITRRLSGEKVRLLAGGDETRVDRLVEVMRWW